MDNPDKNANIGYIRHKTSQHI